MNKYFLIYKPFNVLSQFSPQEGKQTLKDLFDVPVDVYPVGRLDYDSEGLLILTNDKSLNHKLLTPVLSHEREYWVQVEGDITDEAIEKLSAGVKITVEGKDFITKPCKAKRLPAHLEVPPRDPPIRFRKNIPTSWIKLIISEGKNRQVRKMTASVGYPTLRLIRYRIEKLTLEGLQPGEMRIFKQGELYNLLKINQ